MTDYDFNEIPTTFGYEQITNDEFFLDDTGGVHSRGRSGNRFLFTLQFTNTLGEKNSRIRGFIGLLRQQQHRAVLTMANLGYVPRGAYGGSPVVSGAQPVGQTIVPVTGANPSVVNWAQQGDFISIGNRLRMVVEAADSDIGGNVSLNVWPEVYPALSGAEVVNVAPANIKGIFWYRDAQGMGSVPFGDGWLSPTITLVLEQDVRAA